TPVWEPGGTRLILRSENRLTLLDTRTWTQQTVLNVPDNTTNSCFSPRDDLCVCAGWEGQLRLWNPTTGRELFAQPGSRIPPQFNRDGSQLAATVQGTSLQIWEVAGNRICRVLRTPRERRDGTWSMHFSPDGSLLAVAGGGGGRIWEVATGRDLADLPTGICSGVVFSP